MVLSLWTGSSVQEQLVQPPIVVSVTTFPGGPQTRGKRLDELFWQPTCCHFSSRVAKTQPVTGACSLMWTASTKSFSAENLFNPKLKTM